jgi:UDP-N-acetylglucosamine--N-acetylmuramyl-(pentapeptide) pyrophosphoryl-undecaprenol N-acetylglucosamine transferase
VGRFLRIPTLIHQLDIRPGLANKLMAPFARAITVTFEKSLQDFQGQKTLWTGAPVRREILQATTNSISLRPNRPVVLIFGGGTGAQAINELTINALEELTKTVEVIHITGKGKGKSVTREGYYPFEFLSAEMGEAYAKADLVVTRAGLGTFLELAALHKPAIVIPMPRSHQEDNAMVLWEAKAAQVMDQTGLSPQEFASAIVKLLNDEQARALYGAHIASFYRPGSARAIIDKILEIGYGQELV